MVEVHTTVIKIADVPKGLVKFDWISIFRKVQDLKDGEALKVDGINKSTVKQAVERFNKNRTAKEREVVSRSLKDGAYLYLRISLLRN